MKLSFCGTGHTCCASGLFGGHGGSLADHWIVNHRSAEVVQRLPNAGEAVVKPDQEWVALAGGGGGFGDPLERNPEAVRDDVRDGFVSVQAARDIYKVIIRTDSELSEVDDAATKTLRAGARSDRLQNFHGIQD